jgi:hypothetical protein
LRGFPPERTVFEMLTAIPVEVTAEEKLAEITARYEFLLELVTTLRAENENLKAELIGVPIEELPF